MRVYHFQVGDVTILRLRGELQLGQVTWIRELVSEALSRGHRKLLLDFTRVSKVDGSCIWELKALEGRVKNNGGELKLSHVDNTVGFSVATLIDFDVCDKNEAMAIASFN
ncbi:MAG: STAS domain-containing protein [Candidatus Doudnabacteria bacterium]|jgi:anti-anti-sigma factor